MAVFSRYNPNPVGQKMHKGGSGVLLQAHPNVQPQPWMPLKTTTRVDNQWGGRTRVHRVQPNERGKSWPATQQGSWTNNAGFVDTTNTASGKSNNRISQTPRGASGAAGASPGMGGGCGCGCGGGGGLKLQYANRR